MNIVFLTRLYYPHIGGVERHLQGLCKELVKRGHQITIITEQYDHKLPSEEHMDTNIIRIPVDDIPEKQKKWAIWKWISTHENLLNDASIIHVHDVFYWLYWYKFSHPLKKIYLTNHGWEGVYPIPLMSRIQHRLNHILSAGSINVGDYITKWYGTPATFVTYGAV